MSSSGLPLRLTLGKQPYLEQAEARLYPRLQSLALVAARANFRDVYRPLGSLQDGLIQ